MIVELRWWWFRESHVLMHRSQVRDQALSIIASLSFFSYHIVIDALSLGVILDTIRKAVRLKFDSEAPKNENDQRCSAAVVSTE